MLKAVKIYRARKGEDPMLLKSASLPILATVLLACALSISSSVKGDTITLADGTQNTMAGIYTYQVTFSKTSEISNGNGFVIYDFPDVMLSGTTFAWSAGALATFATDSITPGTFSPQVSLSYNYVSSAANSISASAPSGPANGLDNFLTGVLKGTDNPLVDNLSFTYSGTPFSDLGIPLSATITVQTGIAGSGATTSNGNWVSLDDGGGEFGGNVVTVAAPGFGSSPVPLPATFAGGGMLITLLGIAGLAKKLTGLKQA